MCGILFAVSKGVSTGAGRNQHQHRFSEALRSQAWRGPDHLGIQSFDDGRVLLGHNRLAIIDLHEHANQPMSSQSGRWVIVFNGEIYNFARLRERLGITLKTTSDTEVLIEGIEQFGRAFVDELEGMFAFVAYDTQTNTWFAARDGLGIKPLYYYTDDDITIVASEPVAIGGLVSLEPDAESVVEWQLIRRPVPGYSYFERVHELLPGHMLDQRGHSEPFWKLERSATDFTQAALEKLLSEIVGEHEVGDVDTVSLLSGGIDSAIIAALSRVPVCYSVGQTENNEFEGAAESAKVLDKTLLDVTVSEDAIRSAWRHLVQLRREPLAVPNEALIYLVCKALRSNEKIVLTGEGADELFFGYDRIFEWALHKEQFDIGEFLDMYAYSDRPLTPRLAACIEQLSKGKSVIEFVEDWFYFVHLPGLLRRMDSASMAASKEARVPFADRRLAQMMYRQPAPTKIGSGGSKLPLRELAARLGLHGAILRKKIGFSATFAGASGRHNEYKVFQSFVLGELGW